MTIQKDTEGNEKKYLHEFADFSHKRVIEIGCGEGRLTWQYANASSLTIGLDTDPDALRVASIDSPHDRKHQIHFIQTEAGHLPFSKETFDIAILAWSL
ncbi:MAG: class I SAM-dependent methyltransferase [Anaerolineales bacterium]|nr:class I SAM-dependent methyltransferase [Anaerolineales bacterium]HMS00020.1 class I SAM-dependent methyltransferase [Anaerolineales bacterium]HNQ95029.1 class I SAM-dependent methyltransferase [Anaerolineales bacterium]